ncbi:MAG: hypothetical protein AAF744_15660 [Pseudomonadota bacterium]
MMRRILTALALILPLAAGAEGFAQKDLRKVSVSSADFAGGDYEFQSERGRLIIACESCDDLTFINLEIGRSTDGTEARFRSGETTIEKMESICKERSPGCRLTRLDIGGAVGWVSQYKLGPNEGSTAVLFQDGDLLTIRSMSESRNRTGTNMAAALRMLAPQIVGD